MKKLKMNGLFRYKPVIITNDINKETFITFPQRVNEMLEIDVSTKSIRYYNGHWWY